MVLSTVKTPEIKPDEEKAMKEGLRGLLFEVYKATDFLEVAKQGGYEKAENMMTKNKALTEEGQEAIKGIKPTDRQKPYDRSPVIQQKRRPFVPYQNYQPQPAHSMMQPTYSMMQPGPSMMQPSQNMMQPYRNQYSYNNIPQQGGSTLTFGIPFQNMPFRPKGPGPDKSRSTCKACLKVGHWAGDLVCPLNGFQPPPPGI